MNVTELAKSRGYWDVEIRPHTFREARIPKMTQLVTILRGAAVRLRGWDFPHLPHKGDPAIEDGRIQYEYQWNHYIESFRFYPSGLFLDLSGFADDWRDMSEMWGPSPGWERGKQLHITQVVFRFTEILEFTSRLAHSAAGDDVMDLRVRCVGLRGRSLEVDPDRMPFVAPYTASGDVFSYAAQLSRAQLAVPRELALSGAAQLFDHFGWDAPLDVLRDTQSQLQR